MSGQELRDEGAELALKNANDEWKMKAFAALVELASLRQRFTAEEVRAVAGNPPGSPNVMGAVFLRASKKGLIVDVGYRTADREERHANRNRVWIGV